MAAFVGLEMAGVLRFGKRVCVCSVQTESNSGPGWIRRANPYSGKPVYAETVEWSVPEMEETPRNTLERIVWWKSDEVDTKRESLPFLALRNRVMGLEKDQGKANGSLVLEKLKRKPDTKINRVAEIRYKWPDEEGPSPEVDSMRIAAAADSNGDVAVAIQTDSKYFAGDLQHMNRVRAASELPIICTDVINQQYQFYELRYHRADAAVVLAAVYTKEDMDYNLKIAKVLGLALFVEVHSVEELDYALSFKDLKAILAGPRDLNSMRSSFVDSENLVSERIDELRSRNIIVLAEGREEEIEADSGLIDAVIVYRD
mmetsp:Transcript_11433/g.16481  ORF Transcript_11433/g.16481 Transcript_11433/m.16481 type:complete len:315 (-) Transcript_11433:217-1161(-)